MKEKTDFSKFIIWGGVIIAAIVAVVFLSKPKSNLHVTSVSGKAQLTRNGQVLYLIPGEALFNGDKIVVTEGTVLFNFNTEQSSIEPQEGSTLLINYDAGSMVQHKLFTVSSGLVKFNFQAQTELQSLKVKTPDSEINISDADFSVSVDGKNSIVAITRGRAILTHESSGDHIDLEEKYQAEFQENSFANINSIGKTSLPKVLNYALINPESNSIINKYAVLNNGAVISISDLPEAGYNLRANIANTSIIKHVRFTLTDNAGRKLHTSTETQAPYSLAGLKGGADFNAFKIKAGTYILTVDVFTPKSAAPVYSSKFKYTLK